MYEQRKQPGCAEMDESHTVYAADIKGLKKKKNPAHRPAHVPSPQLPCISKCSDLVFLCTVNASINLSRFPGLGLEFLLNMILFRASEQTLSLTSAGDVSLRAP